MPTKLHSPIRADGTLSSRLLTAVVVPPGALRLIFAAIVVGAHYAQFSGHHLNAPIDGMAVNGFFVLSGYWVARLWDTTYSKLPSPIPTFYISRAWRIWPLATIGTLLMYALSQTPVGAGTLLSNFALIGLGLESGALNPPEWSLAVEVQFYLVAPLLFLLVRSPGWALGLLALGAACWVPHAFGLTDTSLPVFLVAFVLGTLYARHPLPETAARYALPGLLVFLVLGVLANALPDIPRNTALLRFYIAALTFAILPYIALSVAKTSSKLDRALGDLAFPVYVTHWPAFVVMSGLMPHWVLPAVLATAAASLLLWACVDRPLERARRSFVARQRAKPAAAVETADAWST
jgi:peptidoglycan/LPS O-acetylase OafA/YrhL